MAEASSSPNESLKLLHLSAGNMIGGIETVLSTFAEYAHTCPEMQQEFALAFDGKFAASLRASGAKVHILPEARLRNPFSVLRSRRKLRRLLAEHGFEAVISHSPWCQVVFAPAVRKCDVPLIFWMHGAYDGHWLQRLAKRHSPDLAICNSTYTRATLPNFYPYAPSRIILYPVRPLGGGQVSREETRKQNGTRPESIAILMASRTEAWKGHRNLLQAAAQLPNNHDWTIWIAGAPQTEAEQTYFESVKTETQRLNLGDRVRFLGQRNDVPDLLRATDIFCQPNSAPEPFGVVFVEALQAGVPVVTYGMGGPQEILDQNCGILVQPGNLPALTEGLQRLIEDASLRAKLGSAGPERAKKLCDPARQIRSVFEIVAARCHRD